ncbi:MAG: hypothetical protein HYU77_03445 [Betaproteobacteria bacterium]|nr:hypothetical protein [Betaproteobacteria bacterium]
MELSDLERLFKEARRLCGHAEFVVVGSLAVLGVARGARVPPRMLMSIDVDCYTRQDPARIFELRKELGEGSEFEKSHGYFLDPNDAAVSKYARGEPRDREWLQAGLGAGLLSPAIIESRMGETVFLDEQERQRALRAFAEDRADSP